MTSRRAGLEKITSEQASTANAGLWLDKFLNKTGDKDNTAKGNLVQEVVKKAANSDLQRLYGLFFTCWQRTLESYGAECRKATVKGRMIVGLGSGGVLETSVTLHRTYGVPYIPGSALKGLARNFANRCDGWTKDHTQVVFGNDKKTDDASAGYVTFFDALYVPQQLQNSGQFQPFLHPDVMTVHHPEYYMNEGVPPADWDDPTPIQFLSVNGTYLIALSGPENWIEPTFKLLKLALAEEGIGAKTSSGYGRMEVRLEGK